jgi:hypothetical protein
MAPPFSPENNYSSDVVNIAEFVLHGDAPIMHEKLSFLCKPPDSKDVPYSSLVAKVAISDTRMQGENQFSNQFSLFGNSCIQCSLEQLAGRGGICSNCIQSTQLAQTLTGGRGIAANGHRGGQPVVNGGKSAKKAVSTETVSGRRTPPSHAVVPYVCEAKNEPVAATEWLSGGLSEAMLYKHSPEINGQWETTVNNTKQQICQIREFQKSALKGALSVSGPPSDICDGPRTTLMIRNIPSLYTPETLLQEWPNIGAYDFFYLPFNSRLQRNLMYVFINFTTPEGALKFKQNWQKTRLPSYTCQKPLNIGFADVQGKDENLRQLKKKRLLHTKNKLCQPLVFRNGFRLPLEVALADLEAIDSSDRSWGFEAIQ